MKSPDQPSLFQLPEAVEAAPLDPELLALARAVPRELRLGGMSWSHAGWLGSVYAANSDPKLLAAHGLAAYAQHPLLRAVEIDRSFYEPLPVRYFSEVSEQVPEDFRFLVKAHEDCSYYRYPRRPRFGKKQGQLNPRYLDASYASTEVVAPIVAGLGAKLGAILFQFPPNDELPPGTFAAELQRFLGGLPRGVPYAVEVRNARLLTPAYAAALQATGALHTHNIWGEMPTLHDQARLIPPTSRKPLIVRWMMRPGDSYADAGKRFSPFSELVRPDHVNRRQVASLAAKALAHDVPVLVFVNNKAEGCAPLSIIELARLILQT